MRNSKRIHFFMLITEAFEYLLIFHKLKINGKAGEVKGELKYDFNRSEKVATGKNKGSL